jgi:hypothetical protein
MSKHRRRKNKKGNRSHSPAGVKAGNLLFDLDRERTAVFNDSIARNAADLWLQAEREGCREPMVVVISHAAPACAALLEVCAAIRDVDGGLLVTKARLYVTPPTGSISGEYWGLRQPSCSIGWVRRSDRPK